MNLQYIDVKTIFLHTDLEDDVYMSQPNGCIPVWNEDESFMVKPKWANGSSERDSSDESFLA